MQNSQNFYDLFWGMAKLRSGHRAFRYKSSWREARPCGLFASITCPRLLDIHRQPMLFIIFNQTLFKFCSCR